MANSRIVNTDFWKDSYIVDLEPEEKLLFIYLFTNPRTSLAGIYEINIREISFDTALDQSRVKEILHKFAAAEKVYFERNWIVLTNFIKHQRLNPSIIRGIEKAIEELPEWLQSRVSLEQSASSPQISLFNSGEHTDSDTLLPDTPQYNVIKRNIKKLNLKKNNETQMQESNKFDPKSQTPEQRKAYAIAMEKEREQKKRSDEARGRPRSKTETIGQSFERKYR